MQISVWLDTVATAAFNDRVDHRTAFNESLAPPRENLSTSHHTRGIRFRLSTQSSLGAMPHAVLCSTEHLIASGEALSDAA
jgi:hypothetical protein